MNSCKSLLFNVKSWFTFMKLSKKKKGPFSIITILDNNGFTSSHTHDFPLAFPLAQCTRLVRNYNVSYFVKRLANPAPGPTLFDLKWMAFFTKLLSVFNVRLNGKKFSSSKETIFWRKLASTRKNFQATNIDWQDNQYVSISFLTHLKVMTFIKFCFTCSFRWSNS